MDLLDYELIRILPVSRLGTRDDNPDDRAGGVAVAIRDAGCDLVNSIAEDCREARPDSNRAVDVR